MEKITVFIDRETLTEAELEKEMEEAEKNAGEDKGIQEGTGRTFH